MVLDLLSLHNLDIEPLDNLKLIASVLFTISVEELIMTAAASLDRWQFWIDRGGTFTHIVARRPDGQLVIHKLLSENPERYTDAPVQGIRNILGITGDTTDSSAQIAVVKMGTTVATNALLERKGDRRSNGHHSAKYQFLGQYQGTAGFFLCYL